MAWLRRLPHSKNWHAVWIDGSGKKVFRSTRKTVKREAAVVAAGWERLAQAERDAAGDKQRCLAGIVRKAAEAAEAGRLTCDEVRSMLTEVSKLAGAAVENYTVAGWLDSWCDEKRKTSKPATIKRYDASRRRFLDFLEGGHQAVETLGSDDVRRFRDELKDSGRAPKTVNSYLKDLRMMLGAAVSQGHLTRNVAEAVEILPPDENAPAREPMPDAFLVELLKVASDDMAGMIHAGKSGLRIGDAAKLAHGDIDIEAGVVRYRPMKQRKGGRKVVVAPMASSFKAWLLDRPSSDDPGAPLFPSLASKPTGGRDGLSDTFSKLMEKAGLSKEATVAGKRTVAKYSFHSLRHRAVSKLAAAAGVKPELARAVVGHDDERVSAGYTHHEEEAIAGLGALLD